jgi:hypothetical protein
MLDKKHLEYFLAERPYIYICICLKAEKMDILARKLNLIEEFIQISDESLIEKLENLIRSEKQALHDRKLSPMSLPEFHQMIDKAIVDKNEGRIISHKELKRNLSI